MHQLSIITDFSFVVKRLHRGLVNSFTCGWIRKKCACSPFSSTLSHSDCCNGPFQGDSTLRELQRLHECMISASFQLQRKPVTIPVLLFWNFWKKWTNRRSINRHKELRHLMDVLLFWPNRLLWFFHSIDRQCIQHSMGNNQCQDGPTLTTVTRTTVSRVSQIAAVACVLVLLFQSWVFFRKSTETEVFLVS